MSLADKPTTRLSTKGQIILPIEIRRRRRWEAGTRLIVEDTPEGVLLKPAPLFKETRPEEVFGMLPHRGPAKTVEEMQAGIEAEVQRRHARGRY
jgi:AbrB family looped-hinge helix DNA binding protein